jgi:prolyl-tRNA synthetase
MSPFTAAVIPMGMHKSEAVRETALAIYDALRSAGVDAILDDRNERPGVMLADQELLGIPHRIVVGERGLKEGVVEYQHRRDSAATKVPIGNAAAHLRSRLSP